MDPRFVRKEFPALYKRAGRRAEWKRGKRGEAALVIKGTGRRVIVVKSPDPQIFEEAIFILREDWIRKRSAEQVVEEARRAAGDYLRRCAVSGPGRTRRPWKALAAAIFTLGGVVWALVRLLGVG